MNGGRIARFVRAARSLMLLQAAAGLLVLALSLWAFMEVRELAAERDRLQERVAEMERRPLPSAEQTNAVTPTDEPPAAVNTAEPAVPLYVPIPVQVADPNLAAPPPGVIDPGAPPVGTPGAQTPPEQDCSGANASLPRCRPTGRWTRPPIQIRPPGVTPPPEGNQQRPATPN